MKSKKFRLSGFILAEVLHIINMVQEWSEPDSDGTQWAEGYYNTKVRYFKHDGAIHKVDPDEPYYDLGKKADGSYCITFGGDYFDVEIQINADFTLKSADFNYWVDTGDPEEKFWNDLATHNERFAY